MDRRPAAGTRKPPRQERLGLTDLCTPVFGYAGLLPDEAGGTQPGYEQFRREVVASLKRIESEASNHGIEAEDAHLASYGLSLFLDEQIARSAWAHKDQWAMEPLGILLHQDAEGGVNFYKRLEGLGERQKAVKEVFLVCLSLGFRGKYAELEATEQAAQVGEFRRKLVRSIRPKPLAQQSELFPEAYQAASALEDEVPPPPRWWLLASMGAVGVALLMYVLLFWLAGRSPRIAEPQIRAISQPVSGVSGTPSTRQSEEMSP